MKGVVAAFNQEKALVGAFSVITNLRMELFEALTASYLLLTAAEPAGVHVAAGEELVRGGSSSVQPRAWAVLHRSGHDQVRS